ASPVLVTASRPPAPAHGPSSRHAGTPSLHSPPPVTGPSPRPGTLVASRRHPSPAFTAAGHRTITPASDTRRITPTPIPCIPRRRSPDPHPGPGRTSHHADIPPLLSPWSIGRPRAVVAAIRYASRRLA